MGGPPDPLKWDRPDAGFSVVELSVGASLALLVVALALVVFGVLGRQAAAWRASTELASTAGTVLAAVSADLMAATSAPERRGDVVSWTAGAAAIPVVYRLSAGALERGGRPMHGPSVEALSFDVSPRPPSCSDVRLSLSTPARTRRPLTVETTACSRAVPPWPAAPLP